MGTTGIEPFLISSACNLILAQRLARKICAECAEPFEIPKSALLEAGMPEAMIEAAKPVQGAGCPVCGGTGYKGRIALYEVMPFTEALKDAVLNGANTAEIKDIMLSEGIKSLRLSGLTKIAEGTSSLEEILRVTMAD